MFFVTEKQREEKVSVSFNVIGKELTYALNAEINQQLQVLTALHSFYMSEEHVSYEKFHKFTAPFLEQNSSIKALEWVPKIPYSDREFYEEYIKYKASLKEFQLTEKDESGRLIAAEKRSYYYPVYYLTPIISNELVWGFDLASETIRKNTLLKASETTKKIATDPIQLVQNSTQKKYGILVAQAVKKKQKLNGYVVVVYDVQVLMENMIQHFKLNNVEIWLYHKNKLIFTTDTKQDNEVKEHKMVIQENVFFANQNWRLELRPNKLFLASFQSWFSFLISALIFLLGIGVSIIFYLETRRKLLVYNTVEEQTRSLKISNQELEQFAYITSHDLQEPLYTVKSYLGLFQDLYKKQLDEQGLTFLEYAVESTNRMQNMLHELLVFSTLGHKKEFREIDVEFLLKIVLEDFEDYLKTDEITVEIEKIPKVYGDFIELKKVFSHLIENSFKFKDKSRKLTLKVSADLDNRNENMVRISIQDNGIGIKAEYFEKIFVIFQRLHTRDEYKGNGIGLAVCKKIIAIHGGEIFIDSVLKEGTTISFTLPKY